MEENCNYYFKEGVDCKFDFKFLKNLIFKLIT